MNYDQEQILISFIIYLLVVTIFGIYFYRRTKSLSDYVLGGRKLNAWVTSLSAQASDMSGWLLLGLPGYAYLSGFESIWLLLGLLIGTYLNWKFVAFRIRKYTELANNSLTLPNYFENRFRANSKLLRIVSAIFILFFFLIYTSSGFVAGAKLFSSVFNISYQYSLLIGAFVIVGYTFLGGFLAVSWTDLVQGLIMFFAIVFVPTYAVFNNGGLNFTLNELFVLNQDHLNMFTDNLGAPLTIISILSLLGWGLGYFGQPHILARFMAINKASEIAKARKIAMIWVYISLIGATFVGIVGYAMFPIALEGADSEKIFILLVEELMNPFIAGILLAAILAAIMSTADSQLLVASSSLTEDIYKIYIRKSASDNELIWISRVFVILIAIIAFIIALDPNAKVLDLVSYAWAGFGATFGPIILFSIYWNKITENGALAGIIIGGITTILWKYLDGGIFEMYEIIPGFVASCIGIIIFSKGTKEYHNAIDSELKEISNS